MKKCLTCKYEPDWSERSGGEYPRRSGKCKFTPAWVLLPATMKIHESVITRYDDDSGIPTKCPAYEALQGREG